MNRVIPFQLPEKGSFSLDKLKTDDREAWEVVMQIMEHIGSLVSQDNAGAFVNNMQGIIDSGLMYPEIKRDDDSIDLSFKIWSYAEGVYKDSLDLSSSEMDIALFMIDRYISVN
jgi:hypothetical protein